MFAVLNFGALAVKCIQVVASGVPLQGARKWIGIFGSVCGCVSLSVCVCVCQYSYWYVYTNNNNSAYMYICMSAMLGKCATGDRNYSRKLETTTDAQLQQFLVRLFRNTMEEV